MSRFGRRCVAAALAAGVATAAAVAALAPATADAATPVITDLAGASAGTAGTPTAGAATSSKLHTPSGLAVDSSGDLYIADSANNEVEEVTPAGALSVVAGTGTAGAPTAGPAKSSKLSGPQGVAVDSSGDLYIADTGNNEIEKVTPSGTLSVVAGTGTAGTPSFGAAATSSKLNGPQGVAIGPVGYVYIADTGNNEVEKVTVSTGIVTDVAGTGTAGAPTAGTATSSALNGPQGLVVNSTGNTWIADTGNSEVEEVSGTTLSIVAGTGTPGTPTAGTAKSSKLNAPQGVALDSTGDLYIADSGNDDVEEVNTSGTLSIVGGTGAAGAPTYGGAPTSSALDVPTGLLVDSFGDVDIADSAHNTVDQVQAPVLSLSTSAAPAFSDNLNAGDQTPTYTLPLTVQNTGSGAQAGWNLTVTSTAFSTGGGTLASTASSATGVTASCASQACVAPTNGVTYPLAVPAASTPPTAVKLFSAKAATGTGAFTVTPTIGVSIPQNAHAGSYTSTVTVSVVSGP